jgi:hypothetical protein
LQGIFACPEQSPAWSRIGHPSKLEALIGTP